jgi:hypothetical protein
MSEGRRAFEKAAVEYLASWKRALATAREEGRREGLEAAASMVELGFGLELPELTWDGAFTCGRMAKEIRKLAQPKDADSG